MSEETLPMPALPPQPSLLAAIRTHAQERPDERALVFLNGEGQEETVVTWAGVADDAARAAGAWAASGIQPGDVVLIGLDHGYDLVAAFLGALYAGALPVILPYARAGGGRRYAEQAASVAGQTQARAIFCAPSVVQAAQEMPAGLDCAIQPFAIARCARSSPPVPLHQAALDQPFYLQLTSGATGAAKLVVLSQAAVLANIRNTFAARYRTRQPLVGCMPFYHDGGLVACLLIPLVMGQMSVHLSPDVWIARPHLLWGAVTTYQGAVTFLPNFALSFMVHRIPDPREHGFDLGSLRTLFVGAELVIHQDLQRFSRHFHPCGLRETALSGGYGMAEQVAGISVAAWESPPTVDWVDHGQLRSGQAARAVSAGTPGARAVVSCGFPLDGVEVRVVDETFGELPERGIGQVLLRSQHCFSGYYARLDLTAQVLRDGWYCTGDLGYLAGGELYILGRKDDLIIIGGQNIQPQAIEEIAAGVLAARGRLAVAFALRDETLGTQQAVLVCETRDEEPAEQLAAWRAAITRQVYEQLDVTLADVRFVPKGWVMQMDAKIGRAANREKYLAAGYRPEPPDLALLRAAGQDAALLEPALAALFGRVLGVATVSPNDDFFALGGDSLTALRMVLAVEEALDAPVPAEFFQDPTIAHLAHLLAAEEGAQPGIHLREYDRFDHPRRTLTRSRLDRMIEVGPMVRGRVLPYGLGVRLQRIWVKLPLIAPILQQRAAALRIWLQQFEPDALTGQEEELSILANTWHRWREKCIRQPAIIARWVAAENVHLLDDALATGQPIILLGVHVTIRHPAIDFLVRQHSDRAPWVLKHSPNHVAEAVSKLVQAREILDRGGIVFIAGDGGQGTIGLEMPIRGYPWFFRSGAASLALDTNAILLPVFNILKPSGHIQVTFFDPLVSCAGAPQAQVEDLTRQFAVLVDRQWPLLLGSMKWGKLQTILRYSQSGLEPSPLTDNGQSA